MNNIIESFCIRGLFGKKDVELHFKKNVQIYIGENGLGKTTVLNLLYYVISQKFKEMLKVNFAAVEVKIHSRTFKFTKTQIQGYVERDIDDYRRTPVFRHLKKILSPRDINALRKTVDDSAKASVTKMTEVRDYLILIKHNVINVPSIDIYKAVVDLIAENSKTAEINDYVNTINKDEFRLLYFPTYRRIEIDKEYLKKTLLQEKEQETNYFFWDEPNVDDEMKGISKLSRYIHMGMDDFVERKDKLLSLISDISRKKLDALSVDIIKKEIQGYPKGMKIPKEDVNTITTLLSREQVGLGNYDKSRVMKMIETGSIYDDKNKVMLYVLCQLLDIYKSYSTYDKGMKRFVEVCNHYLFDKKLIYDEVALKLYIKFDDEKEPSNISFDLLSSGEKQIISMMSEIYLEPEKDFMFLIDEPELSLSIFWQKRLIPDIMSSGKCKLLFAVTHSPYIFDNEYDPCAIGMNEFMRVNNSTH